jgi:hypothetical protein
VFSFCQVLNSHVVSVLQEFVLDVLVHHVESILGVVFGSPWHLLNDLSPLVSNFDLFLQDKDVFLNREWLFLDLWVKEVDPSLPALLSITVLSLELKLVVVNIFVILLHEVIIEILCYLVPMLGAILLNNLD